LTKRERIRHILRILDRDYPDKGCELEYEPPVELLIGTILAAQATDRKVNEITRRLFKVSNTPQAFLAMSVEELEEHIKSINYYKTKARHIMETCRILVIKHDGRVPDNREELMQLPGVGRKTANVLLSYAFGKPAIAVDTHVFRVASRLGLSAEKDPIHTELAMARSIPRAWWSIAHSSMVLHGRRVCQAKKPLCESCNLAPYCSFYGKSGKERQSVSRRTPAKAAREELSHDKEPKSCE